MRLVKYVLRFFIFWLVVFAAVRLVFIVSINGFIREASFGEIAHAFYAGFLLDLSTIGYLAILPAVIAAFYFGVQQRWIAKVHDILVFVLIVIYILISIGELVLYQEWTSKLTMQALLHFRHPAEVFQSASVKLIILFFSLTILLSVLLIIGYRKTVRITSILSSSERYRAWKALLFLVIFAPSDFIIIRSGFQAIPISESAAYYSTNHVLNDAAVNPLWSFVHNMMEYSSHQETNPFHYFPPEEADRLMHELIPARGLSGAHFLASAKPNIVFIILESYTSYALPHFGGDNFAPFLDSLSREGIAFTRCYSAGYASDQGIPAILSSYPSTPRIAITNQTSKSLNLPCINKDLKEAGYQSGFIFGGQLSYGNIKSYLFNMKFDVLKERSDFSLSLPSGHLGIPDRVFAPYVIKEIDKATSPFMYCWFTISSHSPYDIPEPKKKLTDKQNDYINTIAYTDHAISDFFKEAKKQPWFSKTLFVVVSDHSHYNQHETDIEDKEYHHIVCFFYGDVIKKEFRGKIISNVTSQLDIVPTLLSQFDLKSDAYSFGKNMLDSSAQHFAYYDYHHGSGFVTDSCYISQVKGMNTFSKNTCDSITTKRMSAYYHAFLQKAFEDYLAR